MNGVLEEPIINFIYSFVAFGIGYLAARFSTDIINSILLDNTEFIASVTRYIIYFITAIVAIYQITFLRPFVSLFLLFLLLFAIISTFYSLKDFIKNYIAWKSVSNELEVGYKIKLGNYCGKIKKMNSQYIKIEDEKGKLIIIPNSLVLNRYTIIESNNNSNFPKR